MHHLGDQSFDVVLSSMVLGLVPRPGRFLGELWRVLRPGGALALSTHGHEHYWEAIDAAFRAVPVRMVLGYRLEYWPLKPRRLRRLLEAAGFVEVSTTRLRWQDEHETTLEVLDFFSATSGAWWLSRFAPETATSVEAAMRAYFEARGPRRITQDVVLARGRRPVERRCWWDRPPVRYSTQSCLPRGRAARLLQRLVLHGGRRVPCHRRHCCAAVTYLF